MMPAHRLASIGATLWLAAILSAATAPAEEDAVVNVYTWSDYITPESKTAFEAKTGLHLNIDLFDSNEALEARLSVGRSGYDVVFTNVEPHLARQIPAGLYQKLDRTKLPNWKNLSPSILDLVARSADPGNQYGAPWSWGTIGLGYNIAKASAANGGKAPDSLGQVFDPDQVKAFAACGVSLLDSAYDVFPAALQYLHLDPDDQDPADLKRTADLVGAIRPYVRKFSSSEYLNDLANGDLCLVLGYSGDIVIAAQRAREAKNGVEVAYRIPKEGTSVFVDVMAIPKDAPHPGNAHRLIDFLLEPAVAAQTMNAIGFGTANAAALPLIDPAIRDNPDLYPPEEARLAFKLGTVPSTAFERLRTRAWTRVKSGS